MKPYDWNRQKNILLKATRGVTFEDVINAINDGGLLDVLHHPNKRKYPEQRVYIVKIGSYVYSVPFVEDDQKLFLKTIYPSRKFTKRYIKERRK